MEIRLPTAPQNLFLHFTQQKSLCFKILRVYDSETSFLSLSNRKVCITTQAPLAFLQAHSHMPTECTVTQTAFLSAHSGQMQGVDKWTFVPNEGGLGVEESPQSRLFIKDVAICKIAKENNFRRITE